MKKKYFNIQNTKQSPPLNLELSDVILPRTVLKRKTEKTLVKIVFGVWVCVTWVRTPVSYSDILFS
jgi:hypothetical protein